MFDDYHYCFRLIDGFIVAKLNKDVVYSVHFNLRQGQDALDMEVCEPWLTFSA